MLFYLQFVCHVYRKWDVLSLFPIPVLPQMVSLFSSISLTIMMYVISNSGYDLFQG